MFSSYISRNNGEEKRRDDTCKKAKLINNPKRLGLKSPTWRTMA